MNSVHACECVNHAHLFWKYEIPYDRLCAKNARNDIRKGTKKRDNSWRVKNMSQKKIVWRVYITFNSNEISLDPFLSTIYTVWFSFVSRSIFYWSTGSPYVWAINCVFVLILYAMRVIRIKMLISALISNLVMVGDVNPKHWFNGIYARCNTILFYPNTHTQSPITSSSIES